MKHQTIIHLSSSNQTRAKTTTIQMKRRTTIEIMLRRAKSSSSGSRQPTDIFAQLRYTLVSRSLSSTPTVLVYWSWSHPLLGQYRSWCSLYCVEKYCTRATIHILQPVNRDFKLRFGATSPGRTCQLTSTAQLHDESGVPKQASGIAIKDTFNISCIPPNRVCRNEHSRPVAEVAKR